MISIAILQLNYTIGDIDGNIHKIYKGLKKNNSVDIAITSELSITGYPPKDLLLYPQFIDYTYQKIIKFAYDISHLPALMVGFPERDKQNNKILYNSIALLKDGKIEKVFRKAHLPNYNEFNESRYFTPGNADPYYTMKETKMAVTICEDIWEENHSPNSYNPLENANKDIDIIFNISASPFTMQKNAKRQKLFQNISKQHSNFFVFVNQVGANDSLVFDGRSSIFYNGVMQKELPKFSESCCSVILKNNLDNQINSNKNIIHNNKEKDVFLALKMGLYDFFSKQNLQKAIIGISGGIDSALVATIAKYALGNKNVMGVLMPSLYSSQESIEDGIQLCNNLDIKHHTIPINTILDTFQKAMQKESIMAYKNIVEENLQARIRGNILMAFTNQYKRSMVLNTGNRSEIGVGYCTMYGDMCGGISILGDTPKTLVYSLSKWINRYIEKDVIPQNIIQKPPSAELRPNQKDTDSLLEYGVLDSMLESHIIEKKLPAQIHSKHFTSDELVAMMNLFVSAEFKRKQAPIEIKISSCSLGESWQMPLAANKKWIRIDEKSENV